MAYSVVRAPGLTSPARKHSDEQILRSSLATGPQAGGCEQTPALRSCWSRPRRAAPFFGDVVVTRPAPSYLPMVMPSSTCPAGRQTREQTPTAHALGFELDFERCSLGGLSQGALCQRLHPGSAARHVVVQARAVRTTGLSGAWRGLSFHREVEGCAAASVERLGFADKRQRAVGRKAYRNMTVQVALISPGNFPGARLSSCARTRCCPPGCGSLRTGRRGAGRLPTASSRSHPHPKPCT